MPLTVNQYIRQRLERILPHEEFGVLQGTEWASDFEQLMRNRLIMGRFRYGPMEYKVQHNPAWDLLGSVEKRLKLYRETGNLELLADIANLCLLEFINPSIKGAALRPVDDGEHVQPN